MGILKKLPLLILPLLLFCAEPLVASCNFEYEVSKSSGEKITEIVTTVAKTRALMLAIKKNHLTKLGDEVRKDTPFFQFWAFIFSHPDLVKSMKKIQQSSMKYDPFIAGGRKEILVAYNRDKECFLNIGRGFAKYLHLDEEITVSHLKTGLETLETEKTGLKVFFDYLISEKNK